MRYNELMIKTLLLIAFVLFAGCKTPQPEKSIPPSPATEFLFDRMEIDLSQTGGNIHLVTLFFRLKIENPQSSALKADIQSHKITVNDSEPDPKTTVFKYNDMSDYIEPQSSHEIMLELQINLKEYAQDINAVLSLDLLFQYEKKPEISASVSALANFPNIREPVFSITSIKIKQADLINVKLETNLRVENPNAFPLTLSNFKYELYGDGLFWADGVENDVLTINSNSRNETTLYLTMNFINMRRSLLDEIIAMRDVRYRFTGTAEAVIDTPWLESFGLKFDREGYSPVIR